MAKSAEEKKRDLKRSPFAMQLLKGVFFLGVGVILIIQPWLDGVQWLGWVIIAFSALIGAAGLIRLRNASRMQKQLIAEFENGDAVYAQGLRIGGMLYDFSTFGAQIDSASFDGEQLRFSYSFFARRGGRTGEVVSIPVTADEADKALKVLEAFALPTVEDFMAKQEALEAARNADDEKAPEADEDSSSDKE